MEEQIHRPVSTNLQQQQQHQDQVQKTTTKAVDQFDAAHEAARTLFHLRTKDLTHLAQREQHLESLQEKVSQVHCTQRSITETLAVVDAKHESLVEKCKLREAVLQEREGTALALARRRGSATELQNASKDFAALCCADAGSSGSKKSSSHSHHHQLNVVGELESRIQCCNIINGNKTAASYRNEAAECRRFATEIKALIQHAKTTGETKLDKKQKEQHQARLFSIFKIAKKKKQQQDHNKVEIDSPPSTEEDHKSGDDSPSETESAGVKDASSPASQHLSTLRARVSTILSSFLQQQQTSKNDKNDSDAASENKSNNNNESKDEQQKHDKDCLFSTEVIDGLISEFTSFSAQLEELAELRHHMEQEEAELTDVTQKISQELEQQHAAAADAHSQQEKRCEDLSKNIANTEEQLVNSEQEAAAASAQAESHLGAAEEMDRTAKNNNATIEQQHEQSLQEEKSDVEMQSEFLGRISAGYSQVAELLVSKRNFKDQMGEEGDGEATNASQDDVGDSSSPLYSLRAMELLSKRVGEAQQLAGTKEQEAQAAEQLLEDAAASIKNSQNPVQALIDFAQPQEQQQLGDDAACTEEEKEKEEEKEEEASDEVKAGAKKISSHLWAEALEELCSTAENQLCAELYDINKELL